MVNDRAAAHAVSRLLLLSASFQLLLALARLESVPTVLASGINLLDLKGLRAGPDGRTLAFGLATPCITAFGLISASVGMRAGWPWSRPWALTVALAAIVSAGLIPAPLPSWAVESVWSAMQGAYLWWRFKALC